MLGAAALSCQPVGLRLHLHQSGDRPLEGKDLLLRSEQSQALCSLLRRGASSGGLEAALDTFRNTFRTVESLEQQLL